MIYFVSDDYDAYNIQSFVKEDILASLNFESNTDKILCNSIISHIEKYAAEAIKEDKAASLPYIGVMRNSPIRKLVVKNGPCLKTIRKTMGKDNYKQYVKELFTDAKNKEKERINTINFNKHIKHCISKKYNKLAKNISKTYADCYLLAMSIFIPIDFDEEIEEQYKLLRNESD